MPAFGTPARSILPDGPSALHPVGGDGSEDRPFTVGELSGRIAGTFEKEFPRRVWVQGEVSEANVYRSGHLYLTFVDDGDLLKAVAFSASRNLDFIPESGDVIRAEGEVRSYSRRSQYQLIVRRVQRGGRGEIEARLRELESRLESEGLFAEERKKPLPYLPLRIGLLTSEGSDAYHDFVRTARERFPGANLFARNSPVQGPDAVPALVEGLAALRQVELDVIVITRGGGSFDDLLPFSDEALLRAAAESPVPVVSAIGHEQDRPLLDRVADHRSRTPTAAAKDVLPARDELVEEIGIRRRSAIRAATQAVERRNVELGSLARHRGFARLGTWIENARHEVTAVRHRQERSTYTALHRRADRLSSLIRALDRQHPRKQLDQRRSEIAELRLRLAEMQPLARFERSLVGRARELEGRHPREFLRGRRGALSDLQVRRARLRPLERFVGTRDDFARRLEGAHPGVWLGAMRERLSRRKADLARLRPLDRFDADVRELATRLDALDPHAVLRRGYSLALDADGRVVRSAAAVRAGDSIQVRLSAGALDARVEAVHADDARTRGATDD